MTTIIQWLNETATNGTVIIVAIIAAVIFSGAALHDSAKRKGV